MSIKISCAAFAALACTFTALPTRAQTSAAPVVPLPDTAQAATPAAGPEAGPTIKLNNPTDATPGITVQQARAQGPAAGPEAGPPVKLNSLTDPTPGITVQQARAQAQVNNPGAAPTIKLDTPTDNLQGITVQQARTRGILMPQNQPKVAEVPRP
jgi:hypothetical protein